jgi:hypothetical protein
MKTMKTMMAVAALALASGTVQAQTILDNGGHIVGHVEEDMLARHRRQFDQLMLELQLQRIEQNTRRSAENAAPQRRYHRKPIFLGYNKAGNPVCEDWRGKRYLLFQGQRPGTELRLYPGGHGYEEYPAESGGQQ